MLHAVSHHYLHTYPGGVEALSIDQPYFVNNDGWIKLGSDDFKLQFVVIPIDEIILTLNYYVKNFLE